MVGTIDDPFAAIEAIFRIIPIVITIVVLAGAVAVWILLGSRRVWSAFTTTQQIPLFPYVGDELHRTRRRLIWTFRGCLLGSTAILCFLNLRLSGLLSPAWEMNESSTQLASAIGLIIPSLTTAVGAALAAWSGGRRADPSTRGTLSDYVPRWLWVASTVIVTLSLGFVVIVMAVGGRSEATAIALSPIGLLVACSVLGLLVFLAGWRSLVSRAAGGVSAGWTDATHATALWYLTIVPGTLAASATASLLSRLGYAQPMIDGEISPLAKVANLLDNVTSNQSLFLIILAATIAPLYVAKRLYPERYGAQMAWWDNFRAGRAARRAERRSQGRPQELRARKSSTGS